MASEAALEQALSEMIKKYWETASKMATITLYGKIFDFQSNENWLSDPIVKI